jgi:hypothetical protein
MKCLNLFPDEGKGLLSEYKIFQHRGRGGNKGDGTRAALAGQQGRLSPHKPDECVRSCVLFAAYG